MKYLLFLVCAVSSMQIEPLEVERDNINKLRNKRQDDDRWSWGFVAIPNDPETTTDSVDHTTSSTRTVDSNPCTNQTFSPKPDFNALGKRISETKCYEYIWEVKHRDEVEKRSAECIAYRMKNKGPNGPYFAIGGRDTSPGEFPHMGAIGWKASIGTWVFKCGSSLISSKFVLTAAHCSSATSRDTTLADPVPKIVRLGDKNIIDTFSKGVNVNDKKIIRILVHPQFASPKKYYDIALMELENEVKFTRYIQPACLWSQHDTSKLGTEATLTGWGIVETGSLTISPELQAAVVDVIDQELCDRLLRPSCNRHWCGVQEHQLCAGKLAGGVDACQTNSFDPVRGSSSGLSKGSRVADRGSPLRSARSSYRIETVGLKPTKLHVIKTPILRRCLRVRYTTYTIYDGDSGGPLQMKIPLPTSSQGSMHYVIGVTSFGINCALPNLPGIYTRVSSFIDWIEDNVWK